MQVPDGWGLPLPGTEALTQGMLMEAALSPAETSAFLAHPLPLKASLTVRMMLQPRAAV